MVVGVFLLLSGALSANAAENQGAKLQFVQGDVYDALFEAHSQCDKSLSLSRSEFIVSMFDRFGQQRVTMSTLRELIVHKIDVANEALARIRKDRERYVNNNFAALKQASEDNKDRIVEIGEANKLKRTDAEIAEKSQRIAIQECILETLTPSTQR